MGIVSVSGAKLWIGSPLASKSPPADFASADFNTQSWVTVGWVENMGQFGDEASEITFSSITDNRTQKLKGVRNAGNMALVIGEDYNDEGQQILVAGEKQTFDYAFRVDFNDKPVGGSQPSKRYFIAKIMSSREQLDTVNNVIRLNISLGINSNIVHVDAH